VSALKEHPKNEDSLFIYNVEKGGFNKYSQQRRYQTF